jgi:hypothetical protein
VFKSIEFWIAVSIAILIKVQTSQRLGTWQVLTTIVVAVGAAYVGTEWAQQLTGLPEAVAAALVALTAEGFMRWILLALDDPSMVIKLYKEWRK